MVLERFHQKCDICQREGDEYSTDFTRNCESCSEDVCRLCRDTKCEYVFNMKFVTFSNHEVDFED